MTKSSLTIIIETKDDHFWNDESKQKLHLGCKWAAKAGAKYRYFMVFKEEIVHENDKIWLSQVSINSLSSG